MPVLVGRVVSVPLVGGVEVGAEPPVPEITELETGGGVVVI